MAKEVKSTVLHYCHNNNQIKTQNKTIFRLSKHRLKTSLFVSHILPSSPLNQALFKDSLAPPDQTWSYYGVEALNTYDVEDVEWPCPSALFSLCFT